MWQVYVYGQSSKSQILGKKGPESRRSEWSLKQGRLGVSFPLCSVIGMSKGRRWRVGKSRMQRYVFGAKKLEARVQLSPDQGGD